MKIDMKALLHLFGQTDALTRVYEILARVFLFIAIFTVPLLVLPWTAQGQEINKQTLFLIFVCLGTIAWLATQIMRKKFSVKQGTVFFVSVFFALSVIVSGILSEAVYLSWIGESSQEYMSCFTIFGFWLLFIVGAHLFSKTDTQRLLFSLGIISSAIVGLLAIFEIFGFPLLESNVIGTPSALGLYLSVWAVIVSAVFALSKDSQMFLAKGLLGVITRISGIISIIASAIVLVALDYWVLWLITLFGLICIFIFSFINVNQPTKYVYYILPLILFGLSLVFIFLPTGFQSVYPGEIAPSYSASWRIAEQSMQNKSWLFGSGPGTFAFDYDAYKSVSINQTALWDTHFDRSASHILTMLATYGLLTTCIYLLFIVLILLGSAIYFFKHRQNDFKFAHVWFAGWLMIVVSQFIYSSNFTLSFLFWLLTACLGSQIFERERSYNFSGSARQILVAFYGFALLTVGLLTVIFITFSRYGADVLFARGVVNDSTGVSIDDVIADLEMATRFNKLSDLYARNLANAYLLKTAELLKDTSSDPQQISQYVASSITEAQRAVALSKKNVINWALLGDVYREFAPFVTGADALAVEAYQKAIELSPQNPKYQVALGRSYLIQADKISILLSGEDSQQNQVLFDEALANAVLILEEALNKKSDYAPAQYYLALALERQGNIVEAIERMQATQRVAPYDIGVALQLGLLYLSQGRTSEAEQMFVYAVGLAPNFANARWYLAAVYEQDGEIEKAIEQIEAILIYDSENTLVKQRLERLKAGLVVDEVPEPLEDAIE